MFQTKYDLTEPKRKRIWTNDDSHIMKFNTGGTKKCNKFRGQKEHKHMIKVDMMNKNKWTRVQTYELNIRTRRVDKKKQKNQLHKTWARNEYILLEQQSDIQLLVDIIKHLVSCNLINRHRIGQQWKKNLKQSFKKS